jgi:SAM-dependent methyltransferase
VSTAAGDARRFASTVEHYRRHRPRYPRAFVDEMAAAVGLDRTGRLLDLGCGPAFLAIALRPHVAEAIAMDPEPAMLDAAREEVAAAGLEVGVVQGSSATLGPELAPLRLCTMGRSFHWMDRAATLAALDRLIEPAGAVVLCRSTSPDVPENAWCDLPAVIGRRLAPDPDHPRARGRGDHTPVLLASPFAQVDVLRHREARRVTVEAVIGLALSKSSTAPARLGPNRPAFEAMLAVALEPFLTRGLLDEVIDFEALIARRPDPG